MKKQKGLFNTAEKELCSFDTKKCGRLLSLCLVSAALFTLLPERSASAASVALISPLTGDNKLLWLWLALIILSAFGFVICALISYNKKKKTKK